MYYNLLICLQSFNLVNMLCGVSSRASAAYDLKIHLGTYRAYLGTYRAHLGTYRAHLNPYRTHRSTYKTNHTQPNRKQTPTKS